MAADLLGSGVTPDSPVPPGRLEIGVLPQGLTLPGGWERAGPLDVHINGHRVWSPWLDAATGPLAIPWPPALLPYLDGVAQVDLVDPAEGIVLASGTGRLGESDEHMTLADERGRLLAVTKWGNVGVAVEGADPDLVDRMLQRAAVLIDDLRGDDWVPFIVGGTLLGAARAGTVLPHDDDVDLAVLIPEEGTHPADLVLASFRLQRMLEARGYKVVRHSAAHLQITFLFEGGVTDHYIDIFLAFYRDGSFFEPLAMQVPEETVTIEPLSSVSLGGRSFPAPADVEGWLAACYGPGWRTPDPSFHFDVPLRTRRRFWNWFGNFNLHRTYWTRPRGLLSDEAVVTDALLELFPERGLVVDLGSGGAGASRRFADAGHEVLAVDFEFAAIAAAEMVPGVRARRTNLNDDSDVLDLAVELAEASGPVSFYSGHTYEGLSGEGKRNVLRLLRWTMSRGGVAIFDCWSELLADFRFEDPTTWHVEFTDLQHDAALARSVPSLLEENVRSTPHGPRGWFRARLDPIGAEQDPERGELG